MSSGVGAHCNLIAILGHWRLDQFCKLSHFRTMFDFIEKDCILQNLVCFDSPTPILYTLSFPSGSCVLNVQLIRHTVCALKVAFEERLSFYFLHLNW